MTQGNRLGAVLSTETKEKIRKKIKLAWERKGDSYFSPEGLEHIGQISTRRRPWKHTEQGRSAISEARTKLHATKGELEVLYWGKEQKTRDIAILYGVSTSTVLNHFRKFGIAIKPKTETRNPNWKGGIAALPYPTQFNKAFKDSIKDRNNYQCQWCPTLEQRGGVLCVHHIDFNKANLDPVNLITLCRSCHSTINTQRGGLIQELLAFANNPASPLEDARGGFK